ncbi:MAG: biotin synthase BioB [Planctomycetaceae bacterium]|jgi:biotin synthase|nr:biotin synthase BioB [Planctomycetaceae bacterium]
MQFTLTDIEHAPLEELLCESERVRTATFGNKIDLCAIVNIKSGHCAMNCRFCAQSVHYSTQTKIYPLRSAKELGEATRMLWQQGIFRVGWVASGCGPTKDELAAIIESAEQVLSDSPLGSLCCASLGQLDSDSLARLKKAGFRRYHHNLETSEQFYPQICTTQHWRDRFATVERAKELGWKVCSGGLFGLGETWNDRFQLALTLQTLQVDSIPLNFYNATSGTPFADREPLNFEEALRIVVLFRLMLPNSAIRICGGRPKIFAEHSHMLFRAGADALMTGNYLTTAGISPEQDQKMIHENGLQTVNS